MTECSEAHARFAVSLHFLRTSLSRLLRSPGAPGRRDLSGHIDPERTKPPPAAPRSARLAPGGRLRLRLLVLDLSDSLQFRGRPPDPQRPGPVGPCGRRRLLQGDLLGAEAQEVRRLLMTGTLPESCHGGHAATGTLCPSAHVCAFLELFRLPRARCAAALSSMQCRMPTLFHDSHGRGVISYGKGSIVS